MNEAALPQVFPRPPLAPPTASTPVEPAPPVLAATAAEPRVAAETSAWLTRLTGDDGPASSARRAGVGLALTLPFAIAAGLRTDAPPSEAIVSALGIPVGLALIALVGVSASTLGISLASAPLEPAHAIAVASRGLFRVGVLLAGLAPITALWVAGGRPLEALFATTFVLAVAGASGIGTIARGLVAATATPEGELRAGALIVALLFSMFALVVGCRLWLGSMEGLLAPIGMEAP